MNFPPSYPYNIFTIYFSGSSPLLKSLFSTISIFFCHLTLIFILLLNLTIVFFTFSRSSFFSYKLCSTINLFYCTKYFTTPLIFLLFSIFSTFHSLTLSTFTSFTSFFFYSSICFLYHTIQLMFTTRWILIKLSSCSLITLVDITLSMKYKPIYWFASFFASLSLNIKSFILSGIVYIRGKSPWGWLRDTQTYGTALASAYMLHYLFAMWLQLQMNGWSLRWE